MFFAPEFGYFAFARYRYPHDGAVGGDLGKPQSISLCHLLAWHFSNSLNTPFTPSRTYFAPSLDGLINSIVFVSRFTAFFSHRHLGIESQKMSLI